MSSLVIVIAAASELNPVNAPTSGRIMIVSSFSISRSLIGVIVMSAVPLAWFAGIVSIGRVRAW